jgi:hypothetical protein
MALSIERIVRILNTASPYRPKIAPAAAPAANSSPAILETGKT